MSGQLVLSVSQVNTYIKEMIEADDVLYSVCIRGELSNYKRYPSGHHYFTLKDESATLKCVMFSRNASRLRFTPQNGMQVLVAGRISVYPRDGAFQLYCVSMMPERAGDLSLAFEQLKQKLQKEGLFDELHKKQIPSYPKRIAVITSSAGAAVHDILRILRSRYPAVEVLIVPVRVQGEFAAGEIASAIRYVNQFALADLIITGRGGGSLEDLWPFNEEIVARAIYDSDVPVISAVGHEPDVTISDYVADLRAATPSNAAELAVPDQEELRDKLDFCTRRMSAAVLRNVAINRQQLKFLSGHRALQLPYAIIETRQEIVDQCQEQLIRIMQDYVKAERARMNLVVNKMKPAAVACLSDKKQSVSIAASRLDALSPLKVLTRGYSIVSDMSGIAITDVSRLQKDDTINIRFENGNASAVITAVDGE